MTAAAVSVLDGLDPEQREAALAVRGPVCILAGAGTGKTRAITHRIAYAVRSGAVPPDQLLAVTFTARAAGELRSRLRRLGADGVQARTFHAAALRQLTYFAPRVLGGAMPEVVDNPLRLVSAAASRVRLRADRTELRDLAAEIEWAKAVLVGPEDYPVRAASASREPPTSTATVATVYAEYEAAKRRIGQLDFADLLLIMAGAIEEYADVAEEIRSRYRHFVVDEYQDVSPVQQRLLDAWLGGRDDLCVVGDANQTIYSFAGATPEHLLSFTRRFPDAVVVRLHRDYRSTPQVVELANRLVATGGVSGGDPRLRLVGQRPPGPPPTFAEFDDEPAEAADVAARCRALIDAPECRRPRLRCCSGSMPSQRSTSRRWPRPGCHMSCAAESGSSTGPKSARLGCCSGAQRERRPTRRRSPRPCAVSWRVWAGIQTIHHPAARPGSGGNPSRRS